ncbi:hypothetical protein ACFZPV_007676 (plasmid) [Rhizobium ruizarguesonis]
MAALRQIAFYGKGGIGKSTTKIVSAAEAVTKGLAPMEPVILLARQLKWLLTFLPNDHRYAK